MIIRQRRTIGAVLRVPLDKKWHAYAWTLPEADFAFFNLRTSTDIPVEEIVTQKIAFRVAVHKSAWSTGRWLRVGKIEPPEPIMAPVPTFIRDSINGDYSVYLFGKIRRAKLKDCVGLECAAVWDPEHVEDRLRDHFAGVTNVWEELMALPENKQIKLGYNR